MKSFKQFLNERASVSKKHELILGQELEGGYYIGEDDEYTLIVSPKQEESAGNWHNSNIYCDTLLAGGYNDWILPTKLDLYMLLNNKKHLPSNQGFEDDWYWSNQKSGIEALTVSFKNTGDIYFDTLDSMNFCRPIRKIKKD
jgi:hypothetical protein